MNVLPATNAALIEFCETHAKVWENAPTAIGLTLAQVTDLFTKTQAAQVEAENAAAARLASKAATAGYNNAVATLRADVAELVRQIKAYADLQSNPGAVYVAAQIPAPQPRSQRPVPTKPDDFLVTLETDGAVTLSWTSENAAASEGVYFNISRKLPGQSVYTPIGGASGITAGNRRASFTDASVPASAAAEGVKYIVQGFKGSREGLPSDAVTVQFGIGSGGGFTSAQIKMAA